MCQVIATKTRRATSSKSKGPALYPERAPFWGFFTETDNDVRYNQCKLQSVNHKWLFASPETLTSSRSRVTASMSLYVLVIWPTLSAHKTARNKSGNELLMSQTCQTNNPSNKADFKSCLCVGHKGSPVLLGSSHTVLSTTGFHFPVPGKSLRGLRGAGNFQSCKVLTLCACVVCSHARARALSRGTEDQALE